MDTAAKTASVFGKGGVVGVAVAATVIVVAVLDHSRFSDETRGFESSEWVTIGPRHLDAAAAHSRFDPTRRPCVVFVLS